VVLEVVQLVPAPREILAMTGALRLVQVWELVHDMLGWRGRVCHGELESCQEKEAEVAEDEAVCVGAPASNAAWSSPG
jgi:hypothetical protein